MAAVSTSISAKCHDINDLARWPMPESGTAGTVEIIEVFPGAAERCRMGYLVRRLPYKKHAWKVQWRTYKGGRCVTRDISENELKSHGFSPSMSYDEVVAQKNSLNAREHLRRHQERRARISSRLKQENLVARAFIPENWENEFIQDVISHNAKYPSHWQVCKRLLCELQVDPSQWVRKCNRFYQYFMTHRWSPSHVQKILYILNKWGDFVTEKTGARFKPLELHKQARGHIEDSYHLKRPGGMASKPITWAQVQRARSSLNPDHYNWLHLALWLGLRPKEVDLLHESSGPWTWYVEAGILWLFQPKLSGPREERFKHIPLLTKEQKATVAIIRSGEFTRPLVKTLKHHFGPRTYLYCGRKAFTDLMLSKGYRLEDISIWMGHRSIERTWRNYKDKRKTHLRLVKS